MDKLKMHSPDLTQRNLAAIAALFPAVVTEALDATGNPVSAVDFDLLRQELSDHVIEGPQERYQLDWPGKHAAVFAANAPIAKTLRPVREDSIDFDSTKNLFIEGDNLDALKLLQESYLGKVKLIYIDPPYNTGKDFVYDDDFAISSREFLRASGQVSDSDDRLVANVESSGRFHSDWLSMMYPRLKLARQLLNDTGIIVISIDDGEVSNLRKMCDQIFGEQNFVAQIIWKKRNTPPNDRVIGAQHDYLLVYGRSGASGMRLRPRTEEQIARYKNPDDHPKGPWVAGDLTANVKGGRFVASLHYPIINPKTGTEHWPANRGNWRFNSARMQDLLDRDEIYFGKDGTAQPKLKRFLSDVKEGATWTTLWDFAPFNSEGSAEMTQLFGNGAIFESPKPTGLLRLILQATTDPDSIVLDFFAGSSSMAAATIKQNAADGGTRRFIMIQMAERTGEDSIAFAEGYKTISALSRERIRRDGRAIIQSKQSAQLDLGFRALKVAATNMADTSRTADELEQLALTYAVSSVRPDRTDEDLLFQVLLDWGLDLTEPITVQKIEGRRIFSVANDGLIACFAHEVTDSVVNEIANRRPLRAVFLDAGFASDAARINAEQIFREVSPETEVRAI